MDVDRITRMSGVGQEQNPLWTRQKVRRRKFAEEVAPEAETEAGAEAVEEERREGMLDVMA
ncbi:MAG TPA: hypothetical protein VL990_15520 [Acidobacteriaceae bacterium]|nr:hypothetical protein [Acidobacteriaceae bacterium]